MASILVPVTDAQREEIRKAAFSEGLKMGPYLRNLHRIHMDAIKPHRGRGEPPAKGEPLVVVSYDGYNVGESRVTLSCGWWDADGRLMCLNKMFGESPERYWFEPKENRFSPLWTSDMMTPMSTILARIIVNNYEFPVPWER